MFPPQSEAPRGSTVAGTDSSPYWNPKTETLSKAELRALQTEKLRRLVQRAWNESPFHRRLYERAGVTPDRIRSLDDIRRLPFMTREDWMACQAEQPLFGDLLTRPREEAIRYHLTSGTSGRQPLRVLDSRKDWSWIAEMWCYGFWAFGIRPRDTVFFAFSYGSFIGFWGAHYCCEKIGCLVLPSGNMTTEARVKQIVEMGATVVCATPTYALRMAQAAQEMGIDLREGRQGRARDRVRRTRRFDPRGDQAPDRGDVGREVRRHRRHDRDRHDHDLRVRTPAGRHAHHRGPLHRRGARSDDAWRTGAATASAASASSRRSAAASSR
jgi:hypothetical protein